MTLHRGIAATTPAPSSIDGSRRRPTRAGCSRSFARSPAAGRGRSRSVRCAARRSERGSNTLPGSGPPRLPAASGAGWTPSSPQHPVSRSRSTPTELRHPEPGCRRKLQASRHPVPAHRWTPASPAHPVSRRSWTSNSARHRENDRKRPSARAPSPQPSRDGGESARRRPAVLPGRRRLTPGVQRRPRAAATSVL